MIEDLLHRFGSDVLCVDRDRWRNVYVVGDVHGCADEMAAMLQRIGPAEDELVLFVGDVVRRGPDSPRAVELVAAHANLASVIGNNEIKILEEGYDPEGLGEEHLREIATWPVAAVSDEFVVTHAGYDPTRSLREHRRADLYDGNLVRTEWDLPLFWFELHDAGPTVYFGHLPTYEPIRGARTVGLDTGCVYGGKLTALDTARDRLIQVPAREAYEPRSPEKYYDADRVLSAA